MKRKLNQEQKLYLETRLNEMVSERESRLMEGLLTPQLKSFIIKAINDGSAKLKDHRKIKAAAVKKIHRQEIESHLFESYSKHLSSQEARLGNVDLPRLPREYDFTVVELFEAPPEYRDARQKFEAKMKEIHERLNPLRSLVRTMIDEIYLDPTVDPIEMISDVENYRL